MTHYYRHRHYARTMTDITVDYTFFFLKGTTTTEIYTLSLPTLFRSDDDENEDDWKQKLPIGYILNLEGADVTDGQLDRKSTRLNSSHVAISYAVFCMKKKI